MRVAMYYNNQDVRVEEMPVPDIGPEELLVRVEASGLCGSDVMEWYRIQRAPTVLGHEVAGVVAQVGTKVEGYREGDPVVVTHHVPCNACRYCLNGRHTVCDTLRLTNFDPGGFSEFLRVPEINVDRGLVRIPAGVGFAEASFTEPLACVYRGSGGPTCGRAKAYWSWAAAWQDCCTSTWPGPWGRAGLSLPTWWSTAWPQPAVWGPMSPSPLPKTFRLVCVNPTTGDWRTW